MTISLLVLLIPYIIFLCIWGFLSLVGFYHLARYGGRHLGTYIVGLLYMAGCLVLLQLSYSYLGHVDWNSTITILPEISASTNLGNY